MIRDTPRPCLMLRRVSDFSRRGSYGNQNTTQTSKNTYNGVHARKWIFGNVSKLLFPRFIREYTEHTRHRRYPNEI